MRYAIMAAAAAAVVVKASPVPQAVTEAISPTGPVPPGCTGSWDGSFGIALKNITDGSAAPMKRQAVSHSSEASSSASDHPVAPVSQIDDGQVQGGMHSVMPTMSTASKVEEGHVASVTVTASQCALQVPAVTSSVEPHTTPAETASPVSQIDDGQPQGPTETMMSGDKVTSGSPPSSNITDADSDSTLVACRTNSTLSLTLTDGVLMDNQGRTGYIASNYQFQFDAPPQAGALYTSGFSVCENGSLALGGSHVFYQCRSGGFFNIYDRHWAEQCSPVTIQSLTLKDCE